MTLHHFKFINPYLTASAYEREISESGSSESSSSSKSSSSKSSSSKSSTTTADANASFLPQPGDFMLFTGLPRPGKPFYLVKVQQYHEGTGDIDFQYLNNTSNRQKYKYVWVKETPDGNSEKQQMRQPAGYAADLQYAHRDDFCWVSAKPQTNGDGSYRLLQSEIKRVMKHKHQPGL